MSDGVNGEVRDAGVSGIRPIFVAALAAAMLPPRTQSCDALSSGQQFPITTDLFAHPMSIYWRDRLFSKMHYPSSHAGSPKTRPDSRHLEQGIGPTEARLFFKEVRKTVHAMVACLQFIDAAKFGSIWNRCRSITASAQLRNSSPIP
jgi:hypothetical protein